MITLKRVQIRRIKERWGNIKRAALFDLDGTVFRHQFTIELFCDLAAHHPSKKKIIQPMLDMLDDYNHSRTYNYSVISIYAVSQLREVFMGMRREHVEASARRVLQRLSGCTYVSTRSILHSLHKLPRGKRPVLIAITGAPMEFASRFCQKFGFDLVLGVTYFTKNGRYTGEWDEKTVYQKGEITLALAKQLALNLKRCAAFGDTGSDASMLKLVGHAYAINPNLELQEKLRAHEVNATWIDDHQKTGVQAYRICREGLKDEITLAEAFPSWIPVPNLPGGR